MRTSLGHHVVSVVSLASLRLAFLQWVTLGAAVACGHGESPESLGSGDAASDAGVRPVLFIAPPAPTAAPAPDRDARAVDATGDSPPEAAAPACVPEGGVDEPDEAFADTDCDGIDGDARHAVFVAPTGSDSGAGTADEPLRTLAKAVAAAADNDKSVYVCNGEYAENVRIERAVRVFGGYDCANGWRRVPDRAVVAPASGVPLAIVGVAGPVVVDRLSLRAPNGDPALHGSSSVAASVVRSTGVVFRRSVLRAGDGVAGADGPAPDAPSTTQPLAAGGDSPGPTTCVGTLNGQPLQGSPAACFVVYKGGRGTRWLCPDGFAQGGDGGDGGNIALGVKPSPGRGGTPGSLFAQITKGADGVPGAASLLAFGRIEVGGYVASNAGDSGKPGRSGSAGIGGDGGQSLGRGDLVTTFGVGGGGGAGGHPGCGGNGGKAGGGGGGSFAVISDDSHVRIESSLLEAGRGGDGGAGSEGTPGQAGGEGGPGGAGTHAPDTTGKAGQRGGDGGHGGAGGPGGGGPSVGIAWTSVPPSLEAVTFVVGTPGRGGVSSARIGAQGVVAEIHPPVPSGDAGEGGAP